MKKGERTLRVGTEKVHFNLNQSLKQPDCERSQCMRVENVIHVSKEQNEDPPKECMLNSLYNENLEKEDMAELTEVVLSLKKENNIRGSSNSEMKEQDVEKSFEGLILKEFPKHLKYVFLEKKKSLNL